MSGRELNLDRRLDELFAVPPEEFVKARDWLVRELKERGGADESAQVRALRRPTVAAWGVNRLVRMHRAAVKELVAVGDDLRRAQRRAVSGVGAAPLREASDRRRQVESRLLSAAEGILEGRGGGSALEEIASTLSAAVLDEESARLVLEGRLERPLEAPSAFEVDGGLALVPEPADEDPAAAEERRRMEQLVTAANAARREAREAVERAARAEEEAARLQEVAEAARERAEAAARRAVEARTVATREEAAAHGADDRLREARGGP